MSGHKGLDKWFKQDWVDIGSKKKGGGFAKCGRSKQKKDAKRKYPNLKDIEKILYRNPNLLKINNNIVQRVGPRNVY